MKERKKERKDKRKKDIAKEEKCKLDRQKLMSEASFLYKVILTLESETKDTDCTKKDSLLKYLFLRNERKEKIHEKIRIYVRLFFGFVSLALMIHIASIPLLMTDTFVATLTSSGLDL